MEKSESIKELAIALNKVQANLQTAKKGNENPFFHSKYADLLSIWDACRDVLVENGLSVAQVGDFDEQGNTYLETILLHSSGEWIKGRLPLHAMKPDPQGQGSAITYARRYSLSAMIGLCTEVDDDGEGAMGRKQQTQKSQQKPNNAITVTTKEKPIQGKEPADEPGESPLLKAALELGFQEGTVVSEHKEGVAFKNLGDFLMYCFAKKGLIKSQIYKFMEKKDGEDLGDLQEVWKLIDATYPDKEGGK